MVLTIPSAIALMIIPLPLVSVLFGRGETGADDVAAIAVAVAIYGLGLPAFVLQKVVQPLYFARGDTKTPFYYALVAMVINAGIAIGLAPTIGWIAPAIATTLAGWAMVALLWWGTRHMGNAARFDAQVRRRLPRIVLAAGVMGGVLYGATIVLGPALGTDGLRYVALTALIVIGLLSFALVGQVLGALSLSELRSAFRRGA